MFSPPPLYPQPPPPPPPLAQPLPSQHPPKVQYLQPTLLPGSASSLHPTYCRPPLSSLSPRHLFLTGASKLACVVCVGVCVHARAHSRVCECDEKLQAARPDKILLLIAITRSPRRARRSRRAELSHAGCQKPIPVTFLSKCTTGSSPCSAILSGSRPGSRPARVGDYRGPLWSQMGHVDEVKIHEVKNKILV